MHDDDDPMIGQESASRMADEDEGGEPAVGELRNVSIRPAANGGFIASCDRDRGESSRGLGPTPWSPSRDYAFSTKQKLLAWLSDELGG